MNNFFFGCSVRLRIVILELGIKLGMSVLAVILNNGRRPGWRGYPLMIYIVIDSLSKMMYQYNNPQLKEPCVRSLH